MYLLIFPVRKYAVSFRDGARPGYSCRSMVDKYNQSKDMTYGDLRSEYAPYENFDAFKNCRV